MKRIEFIAPVEAMRGNLGETQRDIVYPTHDNSAYDGPVGERNTARNYKPIIVGAKRANGRAYFSVRTKTTNHLTPLAKKSMAAMGATCAVYSAMLKDSTIAAKMDEVFAFMLPSLPQGTTPRSYFMERISIALKNKEYVIDLSAGSISFTVFNPFNEDYDYPAEYRVIINKNILIKFWGELAIDPIYFNVEGVGMGIARADDSLGALTEKNYNILGLSVFEEITGDLIMAGDYFLQVNVGGTLEYADADEVPIKSNYYITSIAP